MYRSYKSINPKRLSTFGIVLFGLLLLFNALLGFFFGQETFLFSSIVAGQNYLLPIYILSAVFLLNRWLGNLMLLDTEGRSVFRLLFPSLSFVISFLGFTPHLLVGGGSFLSSALEFVLLSLSAILAIVLILGTKGDEHSPSLMLALALLLGGLSIFTPKLLFFAPFVFLMLYKLKSLSWRNFFAFLLGLVLVPLFLFPYLWYVYQESVLVLFHNWLRAFGHFNDFSQLNILALATIVLFALQGQFSYSFGTYKFSIAQRMYLSSWHILMCSSLSYVLFLDSANAFALAFLVLSVSLSLSRAVVLLSKRGYYLFLCVFILLMLFNVFIINY